jgi:anti-anti-sigma factor
MGCAPGIEVSVREAPGELIIRVGGEAGVKQVSELAGALFGLSARRAPLFTLDLSGLRSVSSLALGALVAFRRGVVRAGGRVRLEAGLQEPVRESVERTGLLDLFGSPEEGQTASAHDKAPPAQHRKAAGERVNVVPRVQSLERAHGLTWGELVGLEPRLAELLWQAREAGASCRAWEDLPRVFTPFRNAVAELVGFRSRHSRHPILGSVGAYEVAYWRLHEAIAGLMPRLASAQDAERASAETPSHEAHALAPRQ